MKPYFGDEIDETVDPTERESYEEYRRRIGEQLRRARIKRCMTIERLAERSGLTTSHIERIEDGALAFTHNTIRMISAGLGVEKIETEIDY